MLGFDGDDVLHGDHLAVSAGTGTDYVWGGPETDTLVGGEGPGDTCDDTGPPNVYDATCEVVIR